MTGAQLHRYRWLLAGSKALQERSEAHLARCDWTRCRRAWAGACRLRDAAHELAHRALGVEQWAEYHAAAAVRWEREQRLAAARDRLRRAGKGNAA